MKYLVFNTEAEAEAAEAVISQSMGYPQAGVSALSGDAEPMVITERWAIPRQIVDGRWIIPSPDDQGVEASDDWVPPSPLG